MKYLFYMIVMVLVQICSAFHAIAYDNKLTHRYINEMAVKDNVKINNHLKTVLGMNDGIDTIIGKKTILEWISDGGEKEDEPNERCLAHFHDPLMQDWDRAGLFENYSSMIHWAQMPKVSSNQYSWESAKEYYYQALTTGLEEYYAKTFCALGQVMHLVSDAAVPAHVRNDAHVKKDIFEITIWNDSDEYETWIENNPKKVSSIEYNWFSVDNNIFNNAVPNSSAPSPISALWDQNEYIGTDIPDGANNIIGLAEYTNANFWTEDTFGEYDYPHPNLNDTNYDENVWLNPEPIDAEDGEIDNRIYFSKTNGDPVEHFMAAGYWYYQLYMWNKPEVMHSAAILDETCFEDYAEKLIPRAIGYSTALLNYFFRGSMDVREISIQGDGYWISGLDFEVKNTTVMPDGSTVEPFGAGDFSLAYRYTIPGETEPVFGLASNIYTVDDLYDPINDDFTPVSVYFPDEGYIPPEAINVSFTLVFKGRLGNEDNAVVAKVFEKPSWIAYSYRPDGWPNPSNIYTQRPDGSDRRKITSDDWYLGYFFSPAWGPHGMSLAFENNYASCTGIDGCYETPRDILIVDMPSGNIIRRITINDESHVHPIHTIAHPNFSPDGSRLAAIAVGLGTDETNFYAVVVIDVQTGTWNYINGYGYWDRGAIRPNSSHVSWSPLGDKIAYAIYDDSSSVGMNIHTISPNGAGDVKLTTGNSINASPSWSPDGEQIVFVSDRDGGEYLDIWIMDKNGQNMKKIINCSSGCVGPSFSPDGSKIVFSEGMMVYVADSNGDNITIIEEYAQIPSWSH